MFNASFQDSAKGKAMATRDRGVRFGSA